MDKVNSSWKYSKIQDNFTSPTFSNYASSSSYLHSKNFTWMRQCNTSILQTLISFWTKCVKTYTILRFESIQSPNRKLRGREHSFNFRWKPYKNEGSVEVLIVDIFWSKVLDLCQHFSKWTHLLKLVVKYESLFNFHFQVKSC